MNSRNLYSILGVPKDADEKELKRAYRKLAKKYHPDTNQGNVSAEQKFKEVTEAYDILSDPEKRKLYDQFGMAAFDGSMGDPSAWQAQSGNGYEDFFKGDRGYTQYHFHTGGSDDMDDILHDFFGGMFHGYGAKRSAQRSFAGEDLHAEITIRFEEAAFGCDKVITIDGSRKEQLQVHIPAGINEGQSVRLKGKGYSGTNGGKEGDLLLKVHIQESPFFERRGQDVYTKASIPFTTAALGGEATFRTLYGMVQCHVPAGTQSGGKIRLKQKGIVSMKEPSQKGDEYVIIQIEVPKNLSEQERAAIERLREVQRGHGRQNRRAS